MRTRFPLPEAGLSRAALGCLVLDFLLLAFLMLWVSWSPHPYEQGPRVDLSVARIGEVDHPESNDGRRRSELPAFLPTADRDYAYITARVGRSGSISLDGRDVADLTEAVKTTYRPLRGGDRAVAGLIDADPDVPFGDVIRALDAFACAGLVSVDLAADSVRAVVVPQR